jgi:hypothetical protein
VTHGLLQRHAARRAGIDRQEPSGQALGNAVTNGATRREGWRDLPPRRREERERVEQARVVETTTSGPEAGIADDR